MVVPLPQAALSMWSAVSLRPGWQSFSASPFLSRTSPEAVALLASPVDQRGVRWLPLLFGTVGTHAYNQWIYKKRRYDAVNDFTPVTFFSEQPMVLKREGFAGQ